ncbi:MAG: acetyl-CoA acetyltransferase [Polyangia bacterium]
MQDVTSESPGAAPLRPDPVYVLGGAQTDFARNVTKEGRTLFDLGREAILGAIADAAIEAREIQVGHVGNFVGELLSDQGHLGALVPEADPALDGLPTARHEAACASGSVAALAAMADLQAGRYDVACVLGIELMRGRGGFEAQQKLGVAARVPDETAGVAFPWPSLLSAVADEYERRYGEPEQLKAALRALAANNFACAKRNPRAQARGWTLGERSFLDDDEANPVVAGRLRRHDCCPVTDGAACVILASPRFAASWAARHGKDLGAVARITGFGHRTSRLGLRDKLDRSAGSPYLFPHVRAALVEALGRAGLRDAWDLSAIECHDCFTVMEYMILDHLGLGPPGRPYAAVLDGSVLAGGRLPVNSSGGLLGGGHPVGATGVRMLLDASRQVEGRAGGCQVPGARRVATVNIGGSATTVVSFVVERA